MLQKLTEKWKRLVNRFKKDVERTEASTKDRAQTVKTGLVRWQEFFTDNVWVRRTLAFSDLVPYVW